jgi:hypothetical protein
LVQIPRPERFAIHKLIVADRRRGGSDALKSVKDRAQAAFLIGVLAEDRPEDLAEAHEVGIGSGVKWWDRIAASLKRMPQSFAILEALQAAPCPRSGKCRGIVARRETGVYHRANV